jgi:hypothetical protein
MRLDGRDQLVVRFAAQRLAARTIDFLGHDPPFGRARVYAAETSTNGRPTRTTRAGG